MSRVSLTRPLGAGLTSTSTPAVVVPPGAAGRSIAQDTADGPGRDVVGRDVDDDARVWLGPRARTPERASPGSLLGRQAGAGVTRAGASVAQARATSPARVALEKIAAAAPDPAIAALVAQLAQDSTPHALDEAVTKLLGSAVHWVTWTKGALAALPEGPQRTALTAARAAVFTAVARLGTPDFAAELTRAGELLDGYSALGDPYVAGAMAPEHRAQLYGWFVRPGLHPALRALGRGKKCITHFHQSEMFAQALAHLGSALTRLPEGSAAALVQRLGSAVEASLGAATFGAALQLGDLRKEARGLLRADVATALGARFALLRPDVQEAVVDTVSACPSAKALPTLKRLLAAPWFGAATAETQRVLAFCLGYAANVAERSTVEQQRRLLTNTVEQVLSGAIPAEARDLGPRIYGQAMPSEISLNSTVYRLEADLQPSAALRHLALHTLAHEVSHVLSGQRVERSVAYFEEEYRAFSVGFLGEFGRLPNQREGAEHAAYLLTATDGAYAYIAEGLRASPGSYVEHLAALGLDAYAAAKGTAADLKRAAAERPSDVPAPQWGWPGFEENLPRPKSGAP